MSAEADYYAARRARHEDWERERTARDNAALTAVAVLDAVREIDGKEWRYVKANMPAVARYLEKSWAAQQRMTVISLELDAMKAAAEDVASTVASITSGVEQVRISSSGSASGHAERTDDLSSEGMSVQE